MDGAHGVMWKFVKQICLLRREQKHDVDLRSIFLIYFQQAFCFMGSTAVCFTTIRLDLVFELLNTSQIMSTVTALQAATQLEVACRIYIPCVTSR